MIAQCAVCKQLLTGAPVLEVMPDRNDVELAALALEAQRHIDRYHRDLIGAFGLLLAQFSAYLSTLILESDSSEFVTARQQLREQVLEAVRSAEVVRRAEPPAASPEPA